MCTLISDEELVQMSISDLRCMLEKHQVTQEEHRELRTRRRRLQNRKYARKCALKKMTEVEHLAAEVKGETTELQVLRRQLDRLSLATLRIQHQESLLAKFRQRLQLAIDSNCDSSAECVHSVRMLRSDGTSCGTAHLCRTAPTTSSYHSPVSYTGTGSCVRAPSYQAYRASPQTPIQLAAGPGMPSSTSSLYSAWPPGDATQLNPRLRMHLVRPIGCGPVMHGRHLSEF
ncbi:unnamed protein product [Dicrocoelium dendriticum]|nr:unnamed protein product [Dicrocoelium dendriticum]